MKIKEGCRKYDNPLALFDRMEYIRGLSPYDFLSCKRCHHQYVFIVNIIVLLFYLLQIYVVLL